MPYLITPSYLPSSENTCYLHSDGLHASTNSNRFLIHVTQFASSFFFYVSGRNSSQFVTNSSPELEEGNLGFCSGRLKLFDRYQTFPNPLDMDSCTVNESLVLGCEISLGTQLCNKLHSSGASHHYNPEFTVTKLCT